MTGRAAQISQSTERLSVIPPLINLQTGEYIQSNSFWYFLCFLAVIDSRATPQPSGGFNWLGQFLSKTFFRIDFFFYFLIKEKNDPAVTSMSNILQFWLLEACAVVSDRNTC